MAHTGFYALRCICAEWRRTISSWEDKQASGGQRFHWEVEALKQYKDATKARVSTMYVRERAFMDHITSNLPRLNLHPKNGAKMVPLCMMSYVKGG